METFFPDSATSMLYSDTLWMQCIFEFDMQNSNPVSIFVGCDRKTYMIRNFFSGLSKISHTAAGFLEAGCDGTRSDFGASLSPTPLAIAGCPKLRFGPEKLINSALLEAGGDWIDKLEFISDWTAKVFFKFNSKTLNNHSGKLFVFLNYRGFPVTAIGRWK